MDRVRTDNKNYRLQLIGENLLYLRYFNKAEMTLEVMKELNENGLQLIDRKPFYTICDLRNMYASMTSEAKEFVAKDRELNDLKICESILVNNLPVKLLVSGYLRVNKPISKTKVFSDIKLCGDWMESNGCSKESFQLLNKNLTRLT